MTRFISLSVFLFIIGFLPAQAADLSNIQGLNQAQFEALSKDLSSALTYRGVSPAESLGVTGIDVAVEAGATKITDETAWNIATAGNAPTSLVIPRIHVVKGLPFGIDVGVLYSVVPDSNIRLAGGEVKYALIKGGVATPAVALRLGYSQLIGVDQIKLNSTGLDLSISKGFTFVTPYAGIGAVQTTSSPEGPALSAGLTDVTVRQARYFVGVNVNLAVINFGVEADKVGDATTYTGKIGFRF